MQQSYTDNNEDQAGEKNFSHKVAR